MTSHMRLKAVRLFYSNAVSRDRLDPVSGHERLKLGPRPDKVPGGLAVWPS
jgi:hypothetical protein